MKDELQWKLQAWVDGELSESEARRMAVLASEDPEARALVAELRTVAEVMNGAEMVRTVPDSREFYWSKIQRQIAAEERQGTKQPAQPSLLKLWQKLAMPLAGVAAAACMLLVATKPAPTAKVASPCDEITATSDAMDPMTYHDQATGLTIVWLQDKNAAAASAVDNENSADTD